MARQLRIEFPGALYHVMSRGNAKQPIYLDDHDRRAFLERLWRVCERVDWQVWAYCLMPNHYHLLIHTPQANLSRGMQSVNGRYSMAFNVRHERVGHVFQGRFKSLLVDKTSYLLEAARYIVLNPVRSGLCARPEDWRWSSYRAHAGLAVRPAGLAADAILGALGPDRARAQAAFVEFVSAGVGHPDPRATARVPTVLGDDDFTADASAKVRDVSPEVPRAERALTPLCDYARLHPSRNQAIRAAYASGAHTQVEIARHFGLHYTTICRIIGNSGCRDAKKQDVTP
jgi:putative transposase